jgi:hypothetical protein
MICTCCTTTHHLLRWQAGEEVVLGQPDQPEGGSNVVVLLRNDKQVAANESACMPMQSEAPQQASTYARMSPQ